MKSETQPSSSTDLPIFQFKDEIIQSVRRHKTTIIVGETGSGKSTQIPQYLLPLLRHTRTNSIIACTQPRRIAAVSVAQRVAFERNSNIGDEVGYSIRFEDKTSARTQIKFLTDGVLLRECMSDSDLLQYDIIILDEAHERSLQTDILMGLLRQLQDKRPSLHIVVMSATLQIELFRSFFKDANVIKISGRQYPVDIYYAEDSVDDYIDAALLTCLQIHEEEEDGGVLVFLPGQEDIEALNTLLEDHLPSVIPKKLTSASIPTTVSKRKLDSTDNNIYPNKSFSNVRKIDNEGSIILTTQYNTFKIFPLYAAMSADDQMNAFNYSTISMRKFVLSTNIAETSVTISGIKYVVDCGFLKCRMLQTGTGVEMLKVVPIAKAQANQRAGRSGRESAGKCFRLYTEDSFSCLSNVSIPDIQRVNIAQVILQLKSIGIQSPLKFPYLSPPSKESLRNALEILLNLGAFDTNQNLTVHGKKMVSLPLEPIYSNLLLISKQFNCVQEVLYSVSLLSTENILILPYREDEKKSASLAHRHFALKEGDLPTLLHIFDSWLKVNRDKNWANRNYFSQRSLNHAFSISKQLSALLVKIGLDPHISCGANKEQYLKCLAKGLFLNVARLSINQENKLCNAPKNSEVPAVAVSYNQSNKFSDRYKSFNKTIPVSMSKAITSSGVDEDTNAPYKTLNGGQPVHIHPSSVLFSAPSSRKLPQYVVFSELLITTKRYMRGVTAIDATWLTEPVVLPESQS